MESTGDTDALAALAHPGRLAVFRLLARRAPQGVQPSEIAEALGMKRNTLSVHVATLARAGLLASRREGKAVYYALDLARAARLVDFLVNDCCRGRPELCTPLAAASLRRLDTGAPAMADRPYTALFLCSGNSARSIFAEAILRDLGGARFRVFSAGTRPAAEVNPLALSILRQAGHDVSGLRAKDVSEARAPDAPALDFVFTVCDRAANEECPPWPGQPITAHWGIPDPVRADGTEAERALAFRAAYDAMRRRIEAFLALPLDTLDRLSLQHRIDAIDAEAEADEKAG